MTPEDEGIIDNITGKSAHNCVQKDRLKRIETRQDKLETKQDETIENINKKLNLIWTAIKQGDDTNTKYIFMMVGCFIGAIITLIAILR